MTLRRVGDVGLVGLLYHVPPESHPEFPAVEVLAGILGRRALGPALQGAGRDEEGRQRLGQARGRHDPGTLEIMAEVNTKDLAALEKVRDVMYLGARRGDPLGRHPGRGRSGPPVDAQGPRAGRRRSQPDRDRAQRLGRAGRLAALLPQPRPDREGHAGAGQGGRREVPDASNRTVGFFVPTAKPERTPFRRRPTSPSSSRATRAARSSRTGEAFDVSPLAIEARVQRPEPIEGVKLAFLPKKTRGEAVQLHLTLHYGKAENLKGMVEAASFLSEPDDARHEELTRQQIQDALDKNFARLGGGMGWRHAWRRSAARAGHADVHGRDQAGQPSRRPGDPPPDPPRADPAGERVRGHEEREARRPRAGPVRPDAPGHQPHPAPAVAVSRRRRPVRADHRREIERLKKVTLDQVRSLYHDYLGASHGELVVVGDFEPSEVAPDPGQDVRRLEESPSPMRGSSGRSSPA